MAVSPESHISLFAGIGALDRAIGRVFPDSRCLGYVEGESYAAAVLAARMASGDLDDAPVWSDVRTFPTGGLRSRVDMVAGGFPCQDISLAGSGDGITGERSGLFFNLRDIVRDIRPRYVFLENVAALTFRGLDIVLGELAEIGLDAEWGCLRASDVGAPHRRDRWWCLAWSRELLANSDRRGRRELREDHDARASVIEECGRDADGCDPSLADATVGGWGPAEREADAGQPDASGRGPILADATRLQRPGQRWGLRNGGRVREVRQVMGDSGEWPAERRRGSDDLAGAAVCPEREGDQREWGGRAAGDHGARVWPGFPPGPDDRDGWRRFLEQYPDLSPATERAIRRVADGPAVRVDRLRALGNAVVPQQAAAALRVLWYRAFGEYP